MNDISAMRPLPKAYHDLISSGVLTPDPAQAAAVDFLETIALAVEVRSGEGFSLRKLFGKSPSPKGAYIWGEVGRGKTLLMDLFFDNVGISRKRRIHFHEFMDEIHAGITQFRAQSTHDKGRRDPIPTVIKPIIDSVELLCLDEFHVLDITNAMLLQRLFEQLFAAGVVVVATSNVEPSQLYKNGLNRQLFLPFIALLQERSRVLNLTAATDYRHEKFIGQDIYYVGSGDKARDAMDVMWTRMTGGAPSSQGAIRSLGRDIVVPAQAMGVARFKCSDLCEKPLGARDYLKIANSYHTLIIDDVPQFDRSKTSFAKRFILLIDTLYDRGVKVAASFAVSLDNLGADENTAFEFQRCVSRLTEMQSDEYLTAENRSTIPQEK